MPDHGTDVSGDTVGLQQGNCWKLKEMPPFCVHLNHSLNKTDYKQPVLLSVCCEQTKKRKCTRNMITTGCGCFEPQLQTQSCSVYVQRNRVPGLSQVTCNLFFRVVFFFSCLSLSCFIHACSCMCFSSFAASFTVMTTVAFCKADKSLNQKQISVFTCYYSNHL